MSASERRLFSFAWVIVSYFLVAGGVVIALAIAVAARVTDPRAGYAVIAGGALVGGIFAGRASPHRAIVEAAIAGALLVGSLVAFAKLTPIGQLALAFGGDEVTTTMITAAIFAFGGGLVGALLGELSRVAEPSDSAMRWMFLAWLITAGALLIATIVSSVLVVDRAVAEQGLLQAWRDGLVVSDRDVGIAGLIALGVAAGVGGLVSQLAAPRRLAIAIGLAVAVGYAILLALAARGSGGTTDTGQLAIGIAVIAAGGGVIATIGAAIAGIFR
jgi:hypothetical protein